jgi:hypothetical protein
MIRAISPKNALAVAQPLSWVVNRVFKCGEYLALGTNGQPNHVEKQMAVRLEAIHDNRMLCTLNGDESLFNRRFGGVPAQGETLVIEMHPNSRDPSRITNEVTALFFASDDETTVTKLTRTPKAPQPA